MTGWTLSDEGSNVYTFPSFTLQANNTVNVWVTSGTNDSSNLYWGRGSAVWNNTGDTATIKDDQATTINECSYPGGEQGFVCP
jgi:competence protein ComEC